MATNAYDNNNIVDFQQVQQCFKFISSFDDSTKSNVFAPRCASKIWRRSTRVVDKELFVSDATTREMKASCGIDCASKC